MSIAEKWKNFITRMNTEGVPVPTCRDPKTKEGSVSFTLVVVSGGLCTISILMMMAGAITKLSSGIEVNAEGMASLQNSFYASLQFFGASAALYFGRKMTGGAGKISIDSDAKDSGPS